MVLGPGQSRAPARPCPARQGQSRLPWASAPPPPEGHTGSKAGPAGVPSLSPGLCVKSAFCKDARGVFCVQEGAFQRLCRCPLSRGNV